MKQSFFDFLKFLKKPVDAKGTDVTIALKMKSILVVFIFDVLIIGLLQVLISYLESIGIIPNYDDEFSKLYDEHPAMLISFLIIFIAPLFEEFIFRFPLVFKRNYLLRAMISLQSGNSKNGKSLVEDKYRKFWDKHYTIIFYFSAFIFSLIHMSNYTANSMNIFIILLLISPQFILGVLFGFIRVKIGFWQVFLFHSFHNLIALSFIL